MILLGRAYTDIICLNEITLKPNLSEYSSKIIQRYGGIIHVINLLKNNDHLILVGDISTLQYIKKHTVAKISHFNEKNIKCTILNLEGYHSRISIIDNSVTQRLSPLECVKAGEKKLVLVNYYLESIPVDLGEFVSDNNLALDQLLTISIFNGGLGLIDESLLKNNYLFSKILITSHEGYRVLKKLNLSNDDVIKVIHSPKNFIIKNNYKTIEIKNKNYMPNKYKAVIGAGDLFSILICNILESKIKDYELSLDIVVDAAETASETIVGFLDEL